MDDEQSILQLEALVKDLQELTSVESVDDVPHVVDQVVNKMKDAMIYIRHDKDMQIICEEVLGSPLFEEEQDQVLRHLITYDNTEEPNTGYVVYSLLYHLGQYWPNAYRRMAEEDYLEKLRLDVFKRTAERLHLTAMRLMFEISQLHELSMTDIALIDAPFLMLLCDLVEKTRSDELEEYNYTVIRLLLAFNAQFMLKNTARSLVDNRVILTLSKRLNRSKTLSENILFMFNRADNPEVQLLIAKFLVRVFSTRSVCDLFYTNDLKVVVDVVLRELLNHGSEDEVLQHAYLSIIPPLILNTRYADTNYHKAPELLQVLTMLRDDVQGVLRPGTRREAERVLNECGTVLEASGVKIGGMYGRDDHGVKKGKDKGEATPQRALSL
ncbi:hypothetical protein HK102_011220 [Quaeritorhiza haematococci]|nr:hypothetical protein HK102_011220 [Quaeritorhiza haematococci]